MQDTFPKFWQKLKKELEFEYDYQSYDPEISALKKLVESDHKQIEEIILERSEGFWRTIEDDKTSPCLDFPYKEAHIVVSRPFRMRILIVSMYSRTLMARQLQIAQNYFFKEFKDQIVMPVRMTFHQIIMRAKDQGDLSPADFQTSLKLEKPEDLTGQLHFTADDKIADLVIVLNNLGITTVQSCEGHKDRGLHYPFVDFPNIMLFRLLAHLEKWPEAFSEDIALFQHYGDSPGFTKQTFSLIFDSGNLEKDQLLAQNLADYLRPKSFQ